MSPEKASLYVVGRGFFLRFEGQLNVPCRRPLHWMASLRGSFYRPAYLLSFMIRCNGVLTATTKCRIDVQTQLALVAVTMNPILPLNHCFMIDAISSVTACLPITKLWK